MASRPLRPAIATKRAGCRAAPVLPPGVVRVPAPPTLPSLPVSPKRPSSARIASRPWRAMPPALSKRMPDGIRLFIAGRPFPYFPSYSSGRKQAREKNSVPLHSPASPPSSPAVCHALFQTAARQRRGLSPRPEESFFGDGESTRGEGAVFTKNAPSPLAIIFLSLSATVGGSWHPPGPRWLPRRARLQGCGSAGGSAGLPAPGGWCSAG